MTEAVEQQKAYLRAIDELADEYIGGLGPARSELADPALAQRHYKAIEAQASAALPAYKLPYLIGYGVYGLVNSKR